jgi:hypothetical protein
MSGGCFTANACLGDCSSDGWSNRYQVVRDVFWWRIKVGDGSANYGRFYTKVEAEKMAALLLREFRNGIYVAQTGLGAYKESK